MCTEGLTWTCAAADLQHHQLVGWPVLLQHPLQDGPCGLVELPLIPAAISPSHPCTHVLRALTVCAGALALLLLPAKHTVRTRWLTQESLSWDG